MATPNIPDWRPDQSIYTPLQHLFSSVEHSTNATAHDNLYQNIDKIRDNFQLHPYLAFLFSNDTAQSPSTRSMAGIQLKNILKNIKTNEYPIENLDLIMKMSISMMFSNLQSKLLQSTLGSLISVIIKQAKMRWPDFIPALIGAIKSENINISETGFIVLKALCEDVPRILDLDDGDRPSKKIIPELLPFFASSQPKIKILALTCMRPFINMESPIFALIYDQFINSLYPLANDANSEVRQLVCSLLVSTLDFYPKLLAPMIKSVGQFMLVSLEDTDDLVKLEACEFFLSLCRAEIDDAGPTLTELLPSLVPVLLKHMVYSPAELAALREIDDDATTPDKDTDIKPRFHTGSHDAANKADNDGNESDEEGGDDDDESTDWTLRKCSAATLDTLSENFGDGLLPILLPLLKQTFQSPDWLRRECGILAIGAVAEGCWDGINGFLPEIIPYLLNCLTDGQPLIRSISSWTLGRFSEFICENAHHFELFLKNILHLIRTDKNKRVQEAACSAFAVFQENAKDQSKPYQRDIIDTLTTALQTYQKKNILMVYDAISTLASSEPDIFRNQQNVNQVLPIIMQKMHTAANDKNQLQALQECVASISLAIGANFKPFATTIVNIVVSNLEELVTTPSVPVDKDFIGIYLDMVSGITQGLQQDFGEIALQNNNKLPGLVLFCLKDSDPYVNQSALGLLGDLTIHCFPLVQPYLDKIIPLVISLINPEEVHVCNNATWVCGELAMKCGPNIQLYADNIMERLLYLLMQQRLPKSLMENIVNCIGRLGLCCPEQIGYHLPRFVHPWCKCMATSADNHEKDSAFRGMCAMIRCNPNALVMNSVDFAMFCHCVGGIQTLSNELKEDFKQVLHGYKQMLGPNWPKMIEGFPEQLRLHLEQTYQL